jgi:peptide/nickel transport system permease protein
MTDLDLTAAPAASRAAPLEAVAEFVRQDPVLVAALVAGVILLVLAVFAGHIAPFEPDQQKLLARLKPPVGFAGARPEYLLGSDQLGRDILSRALHGLRLTLALAFFGAIVGLLFGALFGTVSGLVGGRVDDLMMAIVDIKISLPFVLVALLVIALAGATIPVLVVVLGLAYWAHFARLIRAQVLSLRDMPYVEAARANGAGPWRIAFRHLGPNIVSPVVVMFTLNVSNLILLESSLSFLGLGVQPPTATLGSMVGQGRDYMATAPWIVAVPAVLIVLVALVVMLIGDALRDRFDVRLRDR